MVDLGGEFSFSQGIIVRIDTYSSIKLMTTIFDKQVHLQDSTQLRLNQADASDVITSRSHDKPKHISITRVPMVTKIGRMVT